MKKTTTAQPQANGGMVNHLTLTHSKPFLLLFAFVLLLAVPYASSTIIGCTNNWPGGACLGNIVYNTSTTLSNDINASGSILIDSGVKGNIF